MFVDQPDRIGRTLVIAITLWGAVGLAVLGIFELAFPPHSTAPARPISACQTSVSIAPYDPSVFPDLALPIMLAPSACRPETARTPITLMRAWLDGAELDGTPKQPAPAVDAALRSRGAELYLERCAGCHGASGDGAGPDGCALDPKPAVHKSGVFELRTTEHEALPTDEDLFGTITRGIHGTGMPPWIALPERDRWALVAHVKSLSKAFEDDVAPPPIAIGHAPPVTPARLDHGRALFASGGCASCHGDAGRGDGAAAKALAIPPRNFTTGHFHRGSSATDIHTTLVTGLDGSPMGSFAKVLAPDDLWDLALFVEALAPSLVDRDHLRCPRSIAPRDPQELFGVRSLVRTLHAGPR
jgi:mono/diheme cytochrome c family protein